ncbi:MAG: hypothetical protein HYU28_07710 [Actinobacteria bacterium]|nr:hypothetical protein [Actinomycetota bacterium]
MGERIRRSLFVAVGALVILLTAACDGNDSGASPPTTKTASDRATSTTTGAADKAAVLADYRSFWDAYLEAADPMDPRHPALEAHAAGDELEQVQRAFLARASAGEVIRGTVDLAPEVVSIDADTARVSDCYLDSTGVFDAETGERKDTASGVRQLVTVELRLDDGTWKVARITREGDRCEPGER